MRIAIVGAGPAGLLTALYLIRRPNYQVEIYERRSDFHTSSSKQERTFPIALQSRGLEAIRQASPGLEAALEDDNDNHSSSDGNDANGGGHGVWIVGMSLHGKKGNKERKIDRPPMLAVERNRIASTLLREVQKAIQADKSFVKIYFDTSVEDVDVPNKLLKVKDSSSSSTTSSARNQMRTVSYDHLIAADGAQSKVRSLLAEKGYLNYDQTRTKESYKSFYISRQSNDGSITLDGERIHGWMFGDNRVLSVPTRPKELSGVFVFPYGKDPFSDLDSKDAVLDFMRSLSPDSLAPLVTPEEAENLIKRPVATTVEAICDRATVGTDVVLLGDACHAVSASLGQGCNSALQDAQVLAGYLDEYQDDWTKALAAYNRDRYPEARAVWELSTYANPTTRWMKFEFIARLLLTSLLPKRLSKILLRPMPMQLLSETSLPYTTVLEKTRWWTERVKASSKNM